VAQKTVLVVDDDPSILVVVRMALQRQGYAVVTAVGSAAVPLAAERQPDVILLDIQMPGMDGPEVSCRLRADSATAHIPIILMSTRQDLRTLSTRLPVDDQLPKPFSLDELYAIVARWLRIAVSGRLRWRDAAGRSFAFDRTCHQIVAWTMPGVGMGRWWAVIRHPAATHGPFATREQAKAEAEKRLLA
jgi:DNA-binding response OmpR family regulator